MRPSKDYPQSGNRLRKFRFFLFIAIPIVSTVDTARKGRLGGVWKGLAVRETFGLIGVPIRLSMRSGGYNPYAPRKR